MKTFKRYERRKDEGYHSIRSRGKSGRKGRLKVG
jgi:hypothetical protein